MFKHFLQFMLFGFTMFAATAPPIAGGDGGGDGAADGSGDSMGDSSDADSGGFDSDATEGDSGADDAGDGGDSDAQDDAAESDTGAGDTDKARVEDPETGDFKGLVSKRLVALKKEAPELAGVFQKYPKVQEQIEASFRRDMAYRELFPTVAEARTMREQFPNGMQDVEQLYSEIHEIEQVDKDFEGRDPQGNYGGHPQLIKNFFERDRDAAVSLFRTLPKEWARLDPESYSDVMGAIVGATLQRSEIPDWITELRDAAKGVKGAEQIATSLDKMLRWSQGFNKQKAAPSEEERRLEGQRQQFKRETDERKQQDFTRFKTSFFSESGKQQQSIIRKNPAIAAVMQSKAIPEAKKADILNKVQQKIIAHCKGSRAYMNKLRTAYNAGNLKEALNLERAQWSYPWVLNKFVRAVLAEETPALVRQNRERARGAASSVSRQPVNRGNQNNQNREARRTTPYKDGHQIRRTNGQAYSTSEILRGVHLKDGFQE